MYENELQKQRRKSLIWGGISMASFIVGAIGGVIIASGRNTKYDNDPGIQKLIEAYELMKNQWYFGKDFENFDDVLIENALNGMLDNGDPYTFYTSTEAEQGLSTNKAGFGFSYSFYGGYRYINEVYTGSPADTAGLKKGDVMMGFYKTDDTFVDFKTMSRDEGTASLNNNNENTIRFKIMRSNDVSDLTMTRGAYSIAGVKSEVVDVKGETVLYLDINTFLDLGIPASVNTAITNTLQNSSSISKIVFDLRDNGGGYVSAATSLVSMFAPADSKIMSYKYANGTTDAVYSSSPIKNINKIGDFSILQNSNSASASEMFTVAMRDLIEKTEVVGTQSYGKGIIQGFHNFSDGSVIRYTMAESLSPKGYSIHKIGISPDKEIPIDPEVFFTYYGDEEVLSKEMKKTILKQINYNFEESYETYEVALGALQVSLGVEVSDTFTRNVAQELQKSLFNQYLEINELTYKTAMGL